MASAWTPLANITLGSAASSVTFSSISQSYRDLVLVIQLKTSGTDIVSMRFNNDTATNYRYVNMAGDGSATSSAANAGNSRIYLNVANTTSTSDWSATTVNIFDYAQTDKHKSALVRFGTASVGVEAVAGRWQSTVAITTVNLLTTLGGTFAAGSTFALYGVSA